jgi:hypothetical protein
MLVIGADAMSKYLDRFDEQTVTIFADGTRTPITHSVLDAGIQNRLRFAPQYPASVHEEGWPRIVRSVLHRAGHQPDDVACWLWTQRNRSTIVQVMQTLGQPQTRAHTIRYKRGVTGTASPATVTRITADQLRQSSGVSFVSVWQDVKGVDFIQTGVVASGIKARGFHGAFNNRMRPLENNRIATLPENGLPAGVFTTIPTVDVGSRPPTAVR